MANAEDAVARLSRMAGKPVADAELERLQRQSFSYFLHETNPDNGLVIDKTAANAGGYARLIATQPMLIVGGSSAG